jgi:DNA-binding IclR family transcriptional regulator
LSEHNCREDKVEECLTKAIFGSKVRPNVFEALANGRMTISELSKSLGVSPATLITCIAPLLPLRIIDMSVEPERSIALGPSNPEESEKSELVDELARRVAETKDTIRKLSHLIVRDGNNC